MFFTALRPSKAKYRQFGCRQWPSSAHYRSALCPTVEIRQSQSRIITLFVGLDVSQKVTAICEVNTGGARVWRGDCASSPEQVDEAIRINAGADARIGLETGPMTPWLVHELRARP